MTTKSLGRGIDSAVPPPPKSIQPTTQASVAPAQKKEKSTFNSRGGEGKKAATVKASAPVKFDKESETEIVQFNRKVPRRVADAFQMLSIKTRRPVALLLEDAIEHLEGIHGKV